MTDTSAATPTPPAAPPGANRWLRRAGVAGLVLAALGVVASMPFTEQGTRWLLRAAQALVPALEVEAPRGPLLGDFAVQRLSWQLAPGQRLVVEHAGWEQPRFEHDRFWGLHLTRLSAGRVALEGRAAPSSARTRLPTDLRLPVGLSIDQVRIDRLDLPALGDRPVRDLRFGLALPAGDHVRHELRQLTLRWERLQAEGSASIGADAPMLLKAQLKLRNDGAAAAPGPTAPAVLQTPWQANLQALGSLSRLRVQGRLRARGESVDADALLRPGEAMPVESAEVRMEGFDLAGLSDSFPHTALAGLVQARLGTQGQTVPLQIDAQLRNTAAGPWGERAVPVRELQLKASTALGDLEEGELQQLVLEVGNAQRSGGRLQGQGLWRTEGQGAQRAIDLRLQTRLQSLRPAELDPHAPKIELSGPARLEWRQPWPADGSAAVLGTGRLQADWTGRALALAAGQPNPAVRLQLDAEGSPERIALRHFEASTGEAAWTASGTATRSATAWQLALDSTLHAFDPAQWLGTLVRWPSSRLDGQLGARLEWRHGDGAWQSRLRGDARLQLQPSVLAGVPAQGELTLRSAQGLQAQARLALGTPANAGAAPVDVTLEGLLDPRSGPAAADHWTARWTARRLDVLSPWLRAVANAATLEGQADGDLQIDGRWPALSARGNWHSDQLRWRSGGAPSTGNAPASATQDLARAADQLVGAAQRAVGAAPTAATRSSAAPAAAADSAHTTLAVSDLQARWQLGSRPGDPFELDLRAAQAQSRPVHLLATTLRGSGTMAQHTLRLQSTLVPQRTTTQVTAQPDGTTRATSGVQDDAPWAVQAQAEGGWALGAATPERSLRRPAATAPWGWNGRLALLQARRAAAPDSAGGAARTASTAPPAVTVTLDPVPLSVLQDDLGLRVAASSTHLRINEAALSIETLRYDTSAAGPSLELRAQLPPTPAVPLLTLVQPGFGWRGDLQWAGRIDLQGRPDTMTALIDLHRESGDLAVADLDLGTAAQSVGLSELSVKVEARGGRWTLQERVAGRQMGRLSGDFTATTRAADWLPGPDAALQGQLDLDISQLGHWGALLPTGWRLTGQLGAQVRASGRIGAPRFDGEVRGQHIAVRNVLQGIDWREANLQAHLTGDALLLDRLVLQAGGGTLSATGRATLSASPTITLQAQAERFAALQRVDRRVVLSGQADLLVDATRLRLTGQLQADEGRIDFSQAEAPSLSSDVAVHRGTDSEAAIGAQRGPQRVLQLDVRANLGRQFRLTGRGLNTRLAGELRLTAANNRPLLQGTIHAEEGTYASYGQKLGIDRGLVVFTGPIDNPRLDVLATRTDISDVKVGVSITGTAQAPRVRLYSDPDMSDTDKLSWLLMGRPSDGLGRSDLALLQRAAYALIAGESDGPSLVQRIGLDNLSVSQSDTGTVQQTVVILGKQISSRWYLGYERSLQATTGTWLLTYKIAQRFTVRAQSGYQNALDLIWSWRWGLNE